MPVVEGPSRFPAPRTAAVTLVTPVPTSFTENLIPQTWYFDPRPFDECRDGQVELRATFTALSNSLTLTQECYTQLWDVRGDGSQRLAYDQRVWNTTIDLAVQ